jgi:multiple sugar transport system ATP-binding protein
VPKAEIDRAVMHAAKILHIEHLLQRKPKDLSAASASVWPSAAPSCASPRSSCSTSRCPTWTPRCACDALRVRQAARGLKTTMVYVTHDQVEAMTLADRIVVLNAGRIEQVGTPLELYEHPENLFVAGFIGSPKMNFLDAELVSGSERVAIVRLADGEQIEALRTSHASAKAGDKLKLGLRPEHLVLGGRDNACAAPSPSSKTSAAPPSPTAPSRAWKTR